MNLQYINRIEGAALAIAQIKEACHHYDQINPDSLVDGLPHPRHVEQLLQNIPLSNVKIAQIDRRAIGYVYVRWWEKTDETYCFYHNGAVMPQYRGRGIGSTLLEWAQARCRELAHIHATNTQAVYASRASETEHEAITLLEANGYDRVHKVIEFDVPPQINLHRPALADGYSLQTIQPAHHIAIWRTMLEAYPDLGQPRRTLTADDFAIFRQRAATYGDLWQTAWRGQHHVAGTVWSRIRANGVGEIYEIAIHPQDRERGLAGALLTRSIKALCQANVEKIRLVTDHDAIKRLCLALGLQPIKTFYYYRQPLAL
jgi:mycothiol synthase